MFVAPGKQGPLYLLENPMKSQSTKTPLLRLDYIQVSDYFFLLRFLKIICPFFLVFILLSFLKQIFFLFRRTRRVRFSRRGFIQSSNWLKLVVNRWIRRCIKKRWSICKRSRQRCKRNWTIWRENRRPACSKRRKSNVDRHSRRMRVALENRRRKLELVSELFIYFDRTIN